MSYTPTEWESTDVVTATRLNALEQAVGDMNMSYTPNVWQNGDILTADKMNALEQAVASGGGGGGDSDFSTASVTVVNNTEGAAMLYIPHYFDGEDSGTNAEFGVNGGETAVASAIMYKGTSFASLYTDATVTASGDIEAHSEGENYYFMITGDGTITIS